MECFWFGRQRFIPISNSKTHKQFHNKATSLRQEALRHSALRPSSQHFRFLQPFPHLPGQNHSAANNPKSQTILLPDAQLRHAAGAGNAGLVPAAPQTAAGLARSAARANRAERDAAPLVPRGQAPQGARAIIPGDERFWSGNTHSCKAGSPSAICRM